MLLRPVVPEGRYSRLLVATGSLFLVLIVYDLATGVLNAEHVTTSFYVGLTALPFLLAVLYAGYWLDTSNLDQQHQRRVALWVFASLLLSLALNILLMTMFPGRSLKGYIGWARWAMAIGGGIGAVIGVFEARSIQRERAAERERLRRTALAEQNERLDEFAGILSHDLRNPLNVATGHLELAKEGDDVDTHLEAATQALDRMDSIIDDTLTLARSGRVIGDAEPVALDEFAEACWKNVDTAAITLEVEPLPTVAADPGRLGQLLENLFRNSVVHGPADATVRVGALSDDSGFFVEDDGAGIDPDDREAVFNVGYTTSTDDGTGLGLAIVKQIADAHGWTTRLVESDAGGVRFEFGNVDTVESAPGRVGAVIG